MANGAVELFPFVAKEGNSYLQSFKWQQVNTKYEIFANTLEELDIAVLLPHCLEVKDKIEIVIGPEAHKGPSLFKVFPRTLSIPVRAMWEVICGEKADGSESPLNFEVVLREFIAANSTPDDRHELHQQLLTGHKPRSLSVQAFYYRLQQLNGYIGWLPGQQTALDRSQLRVAFFNAMPSAWKERFVQAGKSQHSMQMASMVRYFRAQEHLAQQRANDNTMQQRQQRNKSPHKRKTPSGVPKVTPDKKDSKHFKSSRIDDDAPCPIHPGSRHTWGQCNSNIANKNKHTYKNHHDKKTVKHSNTSNTQPSGDGMAADTVPDDASDPVAMPEAEPMETEPAPETNGESFTTTFVDEHRSRDDIMSLTSASLSSTQSNACAGGDAFVSVLDQVFETGSFEEVDSFKTVHNESNSLHIKPIGIVVIQQIHQHDHRRPLRALFDSGSDRTFISRKALPKGANGRHVPSTSFVTLNGAKAVNTEVDLSEVQLPEFSPTKRIDKTFAALVVDDMAGPYDIILGLDFLVPVGIDIRCTTRTICWDDVVVGWQPREYLQSPLFTDALDQTLETMTSSVGDSHCFAVQVGQREILSSKYDEVDTADVANQQQHLTAQQRQELQSVLSNCSTLFNGKLKVFPNYEVHLDLVEGAKPFAYRPYPVAHVHQRVFKEELERLVEIGVLSRTGPAKYLSPSFIIPKKDGRVRWISDFRRINSMIARKVYNLPKIQDILKKRSGYKFFTKLDISMQYYTFALDKPSRELCTICTPFGNYQYNRLPMGIKQSPDIAQQVMESLLRHLEDVDVYIDDVGIFSNSWENHLKTLRKVLKILQDHNFSVNPLKCEWAVKETDWLGYWLTPQGLKPWQKKVDAILAIKRPTTMKELRSFIGAVTFYRDMFPRRSHTLAPLTAQVGRRNLQWSEDCERAFQTAKALLAKDAFLQYPDHNQPFHIYADASDYQLGSVIIQNGKPVAYFSRKLNPAQRNYTVGEKELLSVVETLKEYRSMLLGCPDIHIYTDHRNNTFEKLTTQRVLRWRLAIDEFAPTFHYVKGDDNTLADGLSRLPFFEGQKSNDTPKKSTAKYSEEGTAVSDSFFSLALDTNETLLECFMHLPDQVGVPFNMDFATIALNQEQDVALLEHVNKNSTIFRQQTLAEGVQVYCRVDEEKKTQQIYLPQVLLSRIVRWYHLALGHVGTSRLQDTLRMHFYHPQLNAECEKVVARCDPCQRYKQLGRGHGELASREAPLLPWQDVAIDLVGPWTFENGDDKQEFTALTVIDLVTNLVEVIRLKNKTAAHVAVQFENVWLSRYPRPLNCVHDQGSEFIGWQFQEMLSRNGINDRCITTKNPQANSVCERMHQAIGNTLRVLSTLKPPSGVVDAEHLVDTAIANAVFATRSTFSSALTSTPGAVAFGRDMILNIPMVTDLQIMQQHRQQLIDHRLIVANRKRFSYDYRVGDEVLKLVYQPKKLEPRCTGPFKVERVHANGTLTVRLNETTVERISLRRVKPYRR